MSELVRAWLDNHSAHGGAHRLKELVHEAPDEALELSLEIIRRGPAYQLSSYDTMSPLLEVVQEHGSRVVGRIEAAAESSVAVRRALSRLRVQLERSEQAEAWRSAGQSVIERLTSASRGETDDNTESPLPEFRTRSPESEEMLAAWFKYEQTFWAWEEVGGLVCSAPEQGWGVVLELVDTASPDALGAIGAGPLEDLIVEHPTLVVDWAADQAVTDYRFRECLGHVWLSEREVPREIIDRLYWASNQALLMLEDSAEPWESELDW